MLTKVVWLDENMVFSTPISAEKRAVVKLLKGTSTSVADIARTCSISRASAYRIISARKDNDYAKCKKQTGRPRKLSSTDERHIQRTLVKLRKSEGSIPCSKIMAESGIDLSKISIWTTRRALNRLGYHFLVARKKGLLSQKDLVKRLHFAKRVKQTKPDSFWTETVCFYLDGVSFVHKYNPYSKSCAPACRIWRKANEGLSPGCTSKGSHVGSGGRTVKFFVAISYREGVVFCHRYEHLNGVEFKNIIMQHFQEIFRRSNKPYSRTFIQDGDPSQNSSVAKKALRTIGADLFPIPPRSPDLNPIENIFNLVKSSLAQEAKQKKITCESVEEFTIRIKKTFDNLDKEVINKTISSMPQRINNIIRNKGSRTRY